MDAEIQMYLHQDTSQMADETWARAYKIVCWIKDKERNLLTKSILEGMGAKKDG
jgi:hypothetical protein